RRSARSCARTSGADGTGAQPPRIRGTLTWQRPALLHRALSPPNQGDADVAAPGAAPSGSAPRTRGTLTWQRRALLHRAQRCAVARRPSSFLDSVSFEVRPSYRSTSNPSAEIRKVAGTVSSSSGASISLSAAATGIVRRPIRSIATRIRPRSGARETARKPTRPSYRPASFWSSGNSRAQVPQPGIQRFTSHGRPRIVSGVMLAPSRARARNDAGNGRGGTDRWHAAPRTSAKRKARRRMRDVDAFTARGWRAGGESVLGSRAARLCRAPLT